MDKRPLGIACVSCTEDVVACIEYAKSTKVRYLQLCYFLRFPVASVCALHFHYSRTASNVALQTDVTVAGGRHSLYAFEDGALAIDLRLMDSVEVNPETKTSNYQSCAAAVCLFVCLFVCFWFLFLFLFLFFWHVSLSFVIVWSLLLVEAI